MTIEEIYSHFSPEAGVTTDSRNIEEGQLFFAFKGVSFNGNLYGHQAIEKGAALAIVEELHGEPHPQIIVVESVLETIQKVANQYRNSFDIPFIGITGTNGKTTTKELVNAVLSSHFKVHYTKGNFNNHLGVPLTLLATPKNTEIAIIEMGANHVGDIAELCSIAEPNYGLITNCGRAHIEGFGSEENIKIGKGELYKHLEKINGITFVNSGLDYLMEMSKNNKQELYSNLGITDNTPFIECKTETNTFRTKLIGRYNLPNISVAYHLGKYFKVPEEKMIKALEEYQPDMNRSEMKQWKGITIYLDAYNANPSSVESALISFKEESYAHKTIILGDMFELGENEHRDHQKVVDLADKLGFDQAVFVGNAFSKTELKNNQSIQESDLEVIKSKYLVKKDANAAILIKGSRGMKLEQLLA